MKNTGAWRKALWFFFSCLISQYLRPGMNEPGDFWRRDTDDWCIHVHDLKLAFSEMSHSLLPVELRSRSYICDLSIPSFIWELSENLFMGQGINPGGSAFLAGTWSLAPKRNSYFLSPLEPVEPTVLRKQPQGAQFSIYSTSPCAQGYSQPCLA